MLSRLRVCGVGRNSAGLAEGFRRDESGATTMDWVVLTSVLVSLGVAVGTQASMGLSNSANDISESVRTLQVTGSQRDTTSAQSFFVMGIDQYPDDQRAAWLAARLAVDGQSPDGFDYDPQLREVRYIDTDSGKPIYESADGTQYSINGTVIDAADYDTSGRVSFKNGFDQYWNDTH